MIDVVKELKKEVSKVIVGYSSVLDSLIVGILCEGHILMEGVPGVAKTTTINTLAKALGLQFGRVQFTPDLLPSDIIGAEVFNPKSSEFIVKKGPIFTNLLLADEINRAPAKVQSALLEAMQERQVTIAEESFLLPRPFFVLATQNSIESGGTYALPEAQLDRFMMKIFIKYNTKEEEMEIAERISLETCEAVETVLDEETLKTLQQKIKTVHVDLPVRRYMTDIIFATREPKDYGLEELAPYISFGASPRSSIDLHKASRAYALIHERDYVTPVDVASVCKEVLGHRIILSYEAEADDITVEYIINKILETLPLP
ncbi:AAA family ATPase [Sulfurospirillum arcachonense]|uniref:AAA family ATPase n=1 Tax=Sulfurospirillum arcachonense TaxID=57666 RepID=UPI00046AF9B0|nr:AAA family ATPase [Sulfurospirillum arcachonense]